jgi:hypothetical protein
MPRAKSKAKTTSKGERGTRVGTGTRPAAKKIMKRTTRGRKSTKG